MVRTIIKAKDVPHKFWAEAMNTACHIINRIYIRTNTYMTPYEIWKGMKLNVKYFQVFGVICYVLRDIDNSRKLDDKSEEAIFLGYSVHNKVFRVFLKSTQKVIESINVVFSDHGTIIEELHDEENLDLRLLHSDDLSEHADFEKDEKNKNKDLDKHPSSRVTKNRPISKVIGNLDEGIQTKKREKVDYLKMVGLVSYIGLICYISNIEPKNHIQALTDEFWIEPMQEEFLEFDINEVCEMVPKPENVNVIGTKWTFRNKTDDSGNIIRNKIRLVARGYSQIEGLDYEETFSPVTRLESIRLLIAMACDLKFKLYQMDVKSAFLNGNLKEEVYISQPKGFEDSFHP